MNWIIKLLLIIIMLTGNNSYAALVYDNCIKAGDFGGSEFNNIIVRPIGEGCSNICKDECKAFSRLAGSIELNSDIIEQCLIACRSGRIFTSTVKELASGKDTTSGYVMGTTQYTTGLACDPGNVSELSVGNNMYYTDMVVKPDDNIKIQILIPTDNYSNDIFLCGFSTINIDPNFFSLVNDEWQRNMSQWSAPTSDILYWNARNFIATNTNILLKDGDFLSISYSGQYNSCGSSSPFMGCIGKPDDQNLLIRSPNANLQLTYNSSLFEPLPASSLKVLLADPKTGLYLDNPSDISAYNSLITWHGLRGKVWRSPSPYKIGDDENGTFNNSMLVKPFDMNYMFYGTLENFSSTFTNLGILHPSMDTPANKHLGGYNVQIIRKGCRYSNGERLQYGIGQIKDNSNPKNPSYKMPEEWIDITTDNIENFENIKINYEGKLYLRIKPLDLDKSTLPSCNTNDPVCVDNIATITSMYTAPNTDGQYFVQVTKKAQPTGADKIITNIVNKVRGYLFGSGAPNEGIVQNLFNKLVQNSKMINMIQAMLVLYIAYTGMCFIMGIAQITQKEATVRIVKMGIIAALISPGSWELFNTYFFKLFTDGALELLVRVTAAPDTSPTELQQLLANPTNIFIQFNKPFHIMLSRPTWIKVLAVMGSSILGFFFAIVLAIAIAIYAICIVKATLIYLLSLVGIALLLLLAPIFISFVLFEFTKKMFDAWIKHLLAFAFQPLFVYIFIFIINSILLATLELVLGFTACPVCWFSINLFFKTYCIIPGYAGMHWVNGPVGIIGTPIPRLDAIIYLWVLSQSMYVFTEFGAKLANNIVTGAFVGVDLADTAKTFTSDAKTITTTSLGLPQNPNQGQGQALAPRPGPGPGQRQANAGPNPGPGQGPGQGPGPHPRGVN